MLINAFKDDSGDLNYPDVFKEQGIEVFMPDKGDKDLINLKLFSVIELGIFKDETKQVLIGIIEKMVQEQQNDPLILGCTEFPLILNGESYGSISVLNTTQIHVEAIAKYCCGTIQSDLNRSEGIIV